MILIIIRLPYYKQCWIYSLLYDTLHELCKGLFKITKFVSGIKVYITNYKRDMKSGYHNVTVCFWQESDVVCGSDGQTYPSLCELESTACREQGELRLAYKGDCGEYNAGLILPCYCKNFWFIILNKLKIRCIYWIRCWSWSNGLQ